MALTDLELLKFNLLESKFPYFSDDELNTLLEIYETVSEASYQGCMIKAQDDSITLGKISIQSNEKFWLRRAISFQTFGTGTVSSSGGGGLSIPRADEIVEDD